MQDLGLFQQLLLNDQVLCIVCLRGGSDTEPGVPRYADEFLKGYMCFRGVRITALHREILVDLLEDPRNKHRHTTI